MPAEPQLGGVGDHLAKLGVLDRSDARLQIFGQRRARSGATLLLRRRSLNLLPYAEAHREDAQPERLEARQQLAREQRKLLRPGRRGDEDGEHAAHQRPRLGAPSDAIADHATPGVAIYRDAPALGRNHARAVEQLAEHLGA